MFTLCSAGRRAGTQRTSSGKPNKLEKYQPLERRLTAPVEGALDSLAIAPGALPRDKRDMAPGAVYPDSRDIAPGDLDAERLEIAPGDL